MTHLISNCCKKSTRIDPESEKTFCNGCLQDCTPIESPEEKCECIEFFKHGDCEHLAIKHCLEGAECKGTCEEEKGGWEEKLENLKCVNGSMYFGTVKEPCHGRETGECCRNEQTWDEALAELKSFLRSELATAREEVLSKAEEGLNNCLHLDTMYEYLDKDGKHRRIVLYDEVLEMLLALTPSKLIK